MPSLSTVTFPGCAGLIVAQVQRSKPLAEHESQQPQSWLCRSSGVTASPKLPWPWRIPLEFGSTRAPEDCLIAFRCELIYHPGTQHSKEERRKSVRHEERRTVPQCESGSSPLFSLRWFDPSWWNWPPLHYCLHFRNTRHCYCSSKFYLFKPRSLDTQPLTGDLPHWATGKENLSPPACHLLAVGYLRVGWRL